MHGQSVIVAAGLLVLLAAQQARAALFHRSRVSPSRHASGVSLRKRLHVNDLIAEPGTVELDWDALYSRTTGAFTAPAALKFTPAGNSLFWGRTEYSVAFDSVASAVNAVPEMISPGQTGLLVVPQQPQQVADAVAAGKALPVPLLVRAQEPDAAAQRAGVLERCEDRVPDKGASVGNALERFHERGVHLERDDFEPSALVSHTASSRAGSSTRRLDDAGRDQAGLHASKI